MIDKDELRQKIISASKNNVFLEKIYAHHRKYYNNKQDLFSVLSSLHNSGDIDLFQEFLALTNKSIEGNFWFTRNILEEILIDINISSVKIALQCIEHLINEAGSDMASHTIMTKFKNKLEQDKILFEQVLVLFQENPILYKEFMNTIIMTGSNLDFEKFFKMNLELLSSLDKDIKCKAIYLLGQFDYPNKSKIEVSLDRLISLETNENDDDILANIVYSYFELIYKEPTLFNGSSESFLNDILSKAKEFTFFKISQILFFYNEDEGIDNFNHLQITLKLYKLLKTNLASELGTIQNIGMAFPINNQSELIKEYLDLIEFHLDNGIKLESFGIKHQFQNNPELLQKVITRWLSLGNYKIAFSVNDFFELNDKSLIKPDFEFIDTNTKPNNNFIAHRAIGNLISHTEVLLHFLIHLMEASSKEQATRISNLIFDFILINYPHQKDNIIQWNNNLSDHTHNELLKITKQIEDYLEKLHSIPKIKELYPPIENIIEYNRFHSELMTKGFNDTNERNGLLSQLFTPVTLLYGNKAIFKQEINGQGNRMEVPMNSYSVSVDMPRMLVIDKDQFEFEIKLFQLGEYCNETDS